MELLAKVQEIFKEVFDDEELVVNEASNSDEIEEWDSLMHITILQAIQDEFGISFSIDDISQIKSVGDILILIEEKRR